MEPLVSIVLPTYNGESFIAESIESVINQTYKNWELIIVNDCSTDNTLKIANQYASLDNRIKIFSNEINLKLPASLNVGFENAKGKYYTWTSDDNMYKDSAIEFMVNYLEKNRSIDFVSCGSEYIDENKNSLGRFLDSDSRQAIDLAVKCNVGACFLYTSEIAQKIGKYNENMFCAEDYEYWCRMALVGNIVYLNDDLYLYRLNEQSLTSTQKPVIKKRTEEIQLKYCIPIMKKFKATKEEIVKQLIVFYFQYCNYEWLIKSMKISLFQTIRYYIIGLFCNVKEYLKLLKEEKKLLDYIKKNQDEKIAFWGASLYLENILTKYHIVNKNIVGIVDKNSKRWGQKKCNYTIYSPEQINELNIDTIIFVIKNNRDKIYPQVQEFVNSECKDVKLISFLDD